MRVEALEKTAKIITDNYGIRVISRGTEAKTDGKTIVIPALPTVIDDAIASAFRGYCDHESAHIEYSDCELPKKINPKYMSLTNIFEDARVEALKAEKYIGSKDNMGATLTYIFKTSGMASIDNIWNKLVVEGRRQLWGFDKDYCLFPDFTKQIKARLGDDVFDRMRGMKSSQDAYELAKSIIGDLEDEKNGKGPKGDGKEKGNKGDKGKGKKGDKTNDILDDLDDAVTGTNPDEADDSEDEGLDTAGDKTGKGEEGKGDGKGDSKGEGDKDTSVKSPKETKKGEDVEGGAGGDGDGDDDDKYSPDDLFDPDEITATSAGAKILKDLESVKDPFNTMKDQLKKVHNDAVSSGKYMVYSKEYDKVIAVEEAHNTDKYDELKNSLKNLNTLRARIVTMFKTRTASRWLGGREKGKVNARALASVEAGRTDVFKEKMTCRDVDTAITFLVDFSGSMGITKLTEAMKAVVLFLEALNGAGIKTEVLGYTADDFIPGYGSEGRGRIYGRVEELVTYVFKTFGEPFNATIKKRIANYRTLAKGNNCDVDSLVVAYDRLRVRPEQRKILFMLTDGAVANCGNVDRGKAELKRVCKEIEKAGVVELVCFDMFSGLGRHYFKNVIELTHSDTEGLAEKIFREIKKIFKVK